MVRTTLTLEDDVAALVRQAMRRTKKSLKEVVNDALRAGLRPAESVSREREAPYRTRPLNKGTCLVPSLDDVEGVLALLEGEGHK